MNFIQKINAVWQKVSLVQRALLIAVVLTLGIVGVLLTRWARTPDMTMLYQELAPEEAAKIMGGLMRIGQPVNALDVLIAGTAVANGAERLLSSDRDYEKMSKVSDLKLEFIH